MSDLSILTDPATTVAIKSHAVACYPNESCGVVTAAGFVPLENVSPEPRKAFDCAEAAAEYQINGTLLAVVHSHPAGPRDRVAPTFPSQADMEQQVAMDVAWGLCATEGRNCTIPWFWGTGIVRPPLLRRKFRHGPSGTDGRGDCYALIRDFYLEEWAIDLPEFPRSWDWWVTEHVRDGDLYEDNFAKAGFREIPKTEVRYGDVGLVLNPVADPTGRTLPSRVIHGVINAGDGLVLHHKAGRLSLKEPLGTWNHLVKRWIRHSSQPD
jgi:proteasome lid subunit RPN8/RPN11